MYLSSLFACLLPTYNKNKNNANYRSLGASGAVSAVVFAFIFLEPLRGIGIVFIPFMIPGFIFGFLYLVISTIMDKRGGGNINHSAHIWGALYGIVFLAVTGSFLARYNLFESFARQVSSYIHSL
jgi:membrane associated rhomboid family serine protease